ncbi:unnamed protein product [Pleuronectes platessa]|uniref:Uncharacterized protein n=1 Tax=Pleuronectes platessa TaxID=8262 RepID=A0A9N7UWP0_PLEPL|nr:unnamed protein product [Pleuronectes platessa]
MSLGSRLCASASFPSFPDVGAPPCWPAAASHSMNPANSHSCNQSEHSQKKVSDNPDERKTQFKESSQAQTGFTGPEQIASSPMSARSCSSRPTFC